MATVNLGRIKPVFKGAYNNSTAYVVDDIVTSGGSSYICIQASTGNAVSSATYWTLMASGGTDVGTTLTTQGDILYRDGSGLQRLAKGTAGQVLKINSGATAPEWGTDIGGKLLQVIMAEDTSGRSTNSNTFNTMSATGLNITPSATSSKILIFATTGYYTGGGGYVYSTIFRDGSNVTTDTEGFTKSYSNYDNGHCHSVHYLDSPNTTSQVNYKLAMRTHSGSSHTISTQGQVLTAMEIGV